jgi:hypothetical protein
LLSSRYTATTNRTFDVTLRAVPPPAMSYGARRSLRERAGMSARTPRPTRVPDVLYKFTERRYADMMVNTGAFRIGTLHDFRRIERHAELIGDAEEGIKIVEDAVEGARVETPETQSSVSRQLFKLAPGTRVQLKGLTLQVKVDESDCHIYCFTESSNPGAWPGCDTCVEIRDPPAFIREISRSAGLGDQFKMGKCVYKRRVEPTDDPQAVPAVLIKPRKYAHQQEWRALWPPARTGEVIAPFNVLCPSAVRFCKII